MKESVSICDGRVYLEIRTTVFRDLVGEDEVQKIAEDIKDLDCVYVIQQGISETAWDEGLHSLKEYDKEELMQMARSAISYLKDVRIRSKEGEISISWDMYQHP